MQDKKNFTLLLVVLAVGGAALWYLQSLPAAEVAIPEVVEETVSGATTSDETVSEDTSSNANRTAEPTGVTTVSTPSTPTTKPGASLESDIDAIEASMSASYNDTGLDSTFTSEGANALVNTYEI